MGVINLTTLKILFPRKRIHDLEQFTLGDCFHCVISNQGGSSCSSQHLLWLLGTTPYSKVYFSCLDRLTASTPDYAGHLQFCHWGKSGPWILTFCLGVLENHFFIVLRWEFKFALAEFQHCPFSLLQKRFCCSGRTTFTDAGLGSGNHLKVFRFLLGVNKPTLKQRRNNKGQGKIDQINLSLLSHTHSLCWNQNWSKIKLSFSAQSLHPANKTFGIHEATAFKYGQRTILVRLYLVSNASLFGIREDFMKSRGRRFLKFPKGEKSGPGTASEHASSPSGGHCLHHREPSCSGC